MESTDMSDNIVHRWYRTHVGTPATDDEVQGYWIFVIGTLTAFIGVLLFLVSRPAAAFRQWAYVLAASGLALVIAGPIIRLPLREGANWLVRGGLGLNAVAIVWFVAAYPEQWGQYTGNTPIIVLYAVGLGLMAFGAVFVPILTTREQLEAEVSILERELEYLQSALAESTTDEAELAKLLAEFRAQLGDAKADESDLATRLRTIATSQSRFELYEDDEAAYRWRLRHQNGNIIASSDQGYTQLHNAQSGMKAVRRDAFGASTILYEDEDALPDAEETFESGETEESKATFERYEDRETKYRWRLRHDNGEIIADSGEGYSSKTKAGAAIERVRTYVGPADYLWPDPIAFEVFEDRAEEWRWRLVHRNGNVLADSGEGYASRGNARRAIDTIQNSIDDLEFETYTDSAGEHRFRLRAENGEIMGDSGEGYSTKDSLEDAIERVRSSVPDADRLEIGEAAFELFEDKSGETRWRLRHRNGRILADSGQGYASRSSARDGIESVKLNAPNAEVQDE